MSVLENMHIAKLFGFLQEDRFNFLGTKISRENYSTFRKIIIQAILCTDNARHFADVAKAQQRISSPGNAPVSARVRLARSALDSSSVISLPPSAFPLLVRI